VGAILERYDLCKQIISTFCKRKRAVVVFFLAKNLNKGTYIIKIMQ
jgi:hypothetical protein